MQNHEIIKTEDGSDTLFNLASGEHYHSIHGAVQESMHVFIDSGFLYSAPSNTNFNILEVGFGTGLNCLLTCKESISRDVRIFYDAIEPYPITKAMADKLNYTGLDGLSAFINEFTMMHSFDDGAVTIGPRFMLHKLKSTLESIELIPDNFNLVYFDAFSAEAQPELWKAEIFLKIRKSMVPGGILVTYAAKGIVRRALQQSGFTTERLPGPPGKREMLRATAV